MSDVLDFLKNKTFFVATVENGIPTQRPFGAIMEYENKIYFVTSTTKNVYKQIIKNPFISICAIDQSRKWLRINGKAIKDDREIAKQKMLDENPILLQRKRYTSATDKTMAIFYMENPKHEFIQS